MCLSCTAAVILLTLAGVNVKTEFKVFLLYLVSSFSLLRCLFVMLGSDIVLPAYCLSPSPYV